MKKIYIIIVTFTLILFTTCILFCNNDNSTKPETTTKTLNLETINGLTLNFAKPSDSEEVISNLNCEGLCKGIPSGYYLKIFVKPSTVPTWYPQQPVTIKQDTIWNASVFIGGEDERDNGLSFSIGVVCVTGEDAEDIDKDLSGNTSYYINGSIPAMINVIHISKFQSDW